MTKIIARFSNGFEDEYKGDRAVTAAWMITNRDTGKVLASGHSRDLEAASKTADARIGDLDCGLSWDDYPSFYLPRSAKYLLGGSAKHLIEEVRKYGLADDIAVSKLKASEAFRRAKAANARRMDAKRAKVRIEIVSL